MKNKTKHHEDLKYALNKLAEWSDRQDAGVVCEFYLGLQSMVENFESEHVDIFGTWGCRRTIFGDD